MPYPPNNIVPVLLGDYPDPTVVRVGDDYYLTHSSNQYSPGLLVWHSVDLVNWTPLGTALRRYDGDIWAPDITHYNGLFYIYYSTSGGNHVVTAESASGPWSEPIDLKVGHIDPCHVAIDGKRYIILSGGHIAALTPDGLQITGDLAKVYEGWQIPENWRIECPALEGPKVFQRNGWFYIVWAHGGTAGPSTSHMVTVARSRDFFGPYEEYHGNPIIHTRSRVEQWWSRGHGTIFDTAGGDWWIVYHTYERNYHTLGRSTVLEPIIWTEDGWPVVDASPIRTASLPAITELPPISDKFTSQSLGWQWRFHGDFDPNRAVLEPGRLVLDAEEPNLSEGNAPLTVIPRDHRYLVEVEVEIDSDTVEGGLVLYYNKLRFVGFSISRRGIALRRGEHPEVFIERTDVRKIRLRLVNDDLEVDFFYQLPGEEWKQVPSSQEVSGWHHNSFGGFVALRTGLYAAGSGTASFSDFTYLGL